ncbi:hypothetical protein H2200_003569 [Cladophialophora chaetospira]|uniref:FAD dependent oxidoreductase domain-containing protein n=1 Tax=Cladophialophora chaetospira TaxID=386627 RepID=A0AA39CK42_9EURO|nr:hypothetical protein H2200_003569 [Cladophialophora chaetospira]
MISHESRIIIVGAGVFGLSTSLWLARSGYKDITVFDRCAFDKNYYNPSDGCDGASADINKVFRTSYGSRKDLQALALEARDMWLQWDKILQDSPESELPPGLTREDKLLDICGCYFLAEGPTLRSFYRQGLETSAKETPEWRELQFVKGDLEDERRLRKFDAKWTKKYHVIDKINNGDTNGFIDIAGGINLADKACVYARHLCVKAGVKFVLGDPHGKIEHLVVSGSGLSRRTTGVKTSGGRTHAGDLVIVAGGPWTASIVPEAHLTVEATAGTVMFMDIPKHRTDIWKKFHPDNFPVWSYRKGDGDQYYQGGGFPITKEGRLKFGFLGRKYTSFRDHPTNPDLRVSTPRTKYTSDPISTVPLYGLQRMKRVIGQAFPELADIGFTDSRLCWYTDTVDDEMVIDYVPGYNDSLFVCT